MWLLINHILQVLVHHAVQNKRVSHTSNGRAEQSLLLAHDSEMAPRFRLADEESTSHDGGSIQVMNTSSHAQHWLLVLTFPAHHSFCAVFRGIFVGFYSVSSIQVPLQRQQVATDVITVAIFELLLLGWSRSIINSNNMIRQIWKRLKDNTGNMHSQDKHWGRLGISQKLISQARLGTECLRTRPLENYVSNLAYSGIIRTVYEKRLLVDN